MDKIAFIGSNHILLDRAKHFGYETILIQKPQSTNKNSLIFADKALLLDYEDQNNYSSIVEFVRKQNVSAVITLSESALLVAAKINETLGLGFPNEYKIADCLKDKYKMRNYFSGKPFNIPCLKVSARKELIEFFEAHGKIILKPQAGVGSNRITLIKNLEELNRFEIDESLIAEKYINGKEYSVETFSLAGRHYILGITEKILYKEKGCRFVEQRQVMGNLLNENIKRDICSHVNYFLNDLEVFGGAFHTEVTIDNNGLCYLIESHNRVGGDSIPELVFLKTGVDLYDLSIKSRMKDMSKELSFTTNSKICSTNYFNPLSGKIKRVLGGEYLRINHAVVDYQISEDSFKHAPDCSSSRKRPGYFLVCAENEQEHEKIVEDIYKVVKFEIH